MEIGGITTLPDGRIALCTRRGDVWIVENPYTAYGEAARFTLFASGLHEALGIVYKDGSFFVAQRGELTKLTDKNGDGRADSYETVYAWPLSGHYHEYSFGPLLAPDGNFFVTGNVAFGNDEWWRGESRVPWRGWAMKITPDGTMEPWATGMRSPCGLGIIDGQFFYDDNQGDYFGSSGLWLVNKGSFIAHPAGLKWTGLPNSPLSLTTEQFNAIINPRQEKKDGQYIKPEDVANERNPNTLFSAKEKIPALQLPAVWLPHGILGISNSEIITDKTEGAFGPFASQVLVGDQGQSKIMRVVLEKVKGQYQGVAFDFRSGFQSGVLRMSWGNDASLYVGETNRGWGSAGTTNSGLQRLVWTGRTPFEMKTVKAMPDGFEIEFTLPVNKKIANNLSRYTGRSFTYKYQPVYGSPQINAVPLTIKGVKVSEDGMKVRLLINNLRQYYVHEIKVEGLPSTEGQKELLHPVAYYTLNNIPEGTKLPISEWSTQRSTVSTTIKPVLSKNVKAKAINTNVAPSFAEVKPLLDKYTCTSCHQVEKKQVGPGYKEVAKRGYSIAKLIQLIYQPQPKNWPGYATEMPPMNHVPKKQVELIAKWIQGLGK